MDNGWSETKTKLARNASYLLPDPGGQVVRELLDEIDRLRNSRDLRAAEDTITKLRSALAGLIGASTREELEQLEAGVRVTPAPEADKIAALNAVHALLDTAK